MVIHIDATAIVEVVSFGVFFWLLNMVLYQPMVSLFRQREERIEAGYEAAEESRHRAEETQREIERLLGQARLEAQGLFAAASKAALARRQELMSRASSEANMLIEEARVVLRQERQQVVEALQRDLVPLAILVASRVVGNTLDTTESRAVASRALAEAGKLD